MVDLDELREADEKLTDDEKRENVIRLAFAGDRERLLEKAWTNREIVDAVIDKLSEYKYLDDNQFARDLAFSKLRRKPQGKRRLKQSMSQKKLDRKVVDEAIAAAYEKLPETELIDRAIEKRVQLKGVPQTREDQKKFYDHLLRQGFSYDLIISKMAEISRFRPDEKNEELSE